MAAKKSNMLLTKLIFTVLFNLFFGYTLYAYHIIGGEIYYDYLGNNKYKITLKLYRDCTFNPNAALYDNPARIYVYSLTGAIVDSMEINFPGSDTLIDHTQNRCFIPPTNICVEEAIYIDTVNLPPVPGGYDITYQRCCRNPTILNLINPNSQGTTYTIHIADQNNNPGNNSPRYKNYPPIFLCNGVPLTFDNSATDPDGDSLVYELCDAYQGADPLCPQPGQPGVCPAPPAPPYSLVNWSAGYSSTYPISASKPFKVDPVTGQLIGTPNQLGQWVMAVCVKEYRNGILITTNKRDFQFNVVPCPPYTVSSLPSQTTYCFGKTVNFQNNSVNASVYHWDFGVASLTNDTSNLVAPTYTYADTGVYVVTLYANPGDTCGDTATTTFRIFPPLKPTYVPPPAQCLLTNSYNFTGIDSNSTAKTTYLWNFGTHATPQTSILKNPTGVVFDSAGKYVVQYTVSDFGCMQSFTDTVIVLPPPKPFFAKPTGQCINANSFNFTGTGAVTAGAMYAWTFGPNANPTTGANQTMNNVIYNAVGLYTVTLTITDNGCVVPYSDTLNIYPLPKAAFDPTPAIGCAPFTMQFSDSSLAGTPINYFWTFGDGGTDVVKNPVHIYTNPGVYTVSLTIITVNGCVDTLTFTTPNMITVKASPTAFFTVDPLETTISDPKFNITDKSTGALTCKLMFGDGDSSMNCTASHNYLLPGTYRITQTVMDALGCVDTFFVDVVIELESKIWIPNAFTPNKDLLNEIFYPVMEGMSDYHFMIFDRWGLLLFETNDQTKGWDGTYKGRKCQQDTYVYKVECRDVKDNRKKYVGMVNLLR